MQVTARALALLAAIGTLQGCASIGSVQSADTLGEGNFQIGVEPGVHVAAPVNIQATGTVWPHGDVAFRYGIADRIDLGVRAGSSIIEAQSKFLLTTPGSGFKLSLAPAAGFFVATEIGSAPAFSAALPVLLGIDLHPRFELVVGPRVQFELASDASGTAMQVGVGSSVGVLMQLHRLFALMPEVAFSVPAVLASDAGAYGGTGVFQFQFKVGVLIGPSRRGNALPVTPDAPEPEIESPPAPERQMAPPAPPTPPPSNVPLPPAPPPPPE